MSRMFPISRQIAWVLEYPYVRLGGYPTLVNIEVTKLCNARCDFCDYWKTTSEKKLDDYAPVVRKLKPMVVMLTGGEPLLRRDLEGIIRGIRGTSRAIYLGLMTHGGMLSAERGLRLWNAGLDQIAVSLDFLDERHDRARGIPGLARKILQNAPELAAHGVNVILNTVIKSDNLDQIVEMAHWAEQHGVNISFSTYADTKVGNGDHNVTPEQMGELRRIVAELVRLKRRGAPMLSTTYYMQRIPEFFENGGIGGCIAGRKFATVTPSGHVKRCSEFPVACHYTEWTPDTFGPTDCDVCWFSCRGEAQGPVTIERIRQTLRL